MDLILAITWTIDLIVNGISCARGDEPSWLLVFCPLTILVMKYWINFFTHR